MAEGLMVRVRESELSPESRGVWWKIYESTDSSMEAGMREQEWGCEQSRSFCHRQPEQRWQPEPRRCCGD